MWLRRCFLFGSCLSPWGSGVFVVSDGSLPPLPAGSDLPNRTRGLRVLSNQTYLPNHHFSLSLWIFFSLLPLQVSSSGRLPWFPSLNQVPCPSGHHVLLFDSSRHSVTRSWFNVYLPTGSQETSLAFCYCCFLVWLSFCFSFFTKTLSNANKDWVINTSSPNWWITCSEDSSKLGPLDMFTWKSL